MVKYKLTIDDIGKERTPSDLLSWVEAKFEELGSSEDGVRDLRLRIGLAKQLAEEVFPLAIFALKRYGDIDSVMIRPVIGSQNYDAVITDNSRFPASVSYIEVTQAHEGEERHLREVYLNEHGFVPLQGSVTKKGTKKTGMNISVEFEANSVIEMARRELDMVLDAMRRKEGKDYPPDTSLIVWFNDGLLFRKAISDEEIDGFIRDNITGLDLRLNELYVVGEHREVFRHYNLR